MKQYTSRELSEKLVKLGCKSQSGFYWHTRIEYYFSFPIHDPNEPSVEKSINNGWYLPAFEFEDFCGTHEQARENCRIIWPDTNEDGTLSIKYIMNNPKKTAVLHWEYHRHKMVDSEDWLKYLEKVIENLTPEEPTH